MYTQRIKFLFLFYITLFSCNNKSNDFSESKELTKIDDDTISAKFYNDNGVLEKEGKFLYDSIRIGLWSYYENGKLKSQSEYINKENEEYLNQFWLYDENEEVAGGSYYEINEIGEEYYLGEEIIIEIATPYKYFGKLDSELFLIYSTKEEFEKDLSNRNEIIFDTIWNVQKNFPYETKDDDDFKFYILSKFSPKRIGDFKLNGILIEEAKDFTEQDSLIRSREFFLELEFKIKDTVK